MHVISRIPRMLTIKVTFVALAKPIMDFNQLFTPELFQDIKSHHANRAEYRVKAWQRLIKEKQERAELDNLTLVNNF